MRDHGLDLDAPGVARAARPRARPTRCSGSSAVRTPDGHLELRLQGGGRDRRARRQHRARCATAIRADDLLRLALAGADGRGRRARPHPLGERRHHLAAQRPPAQLRGARRRRRARTSTAALNGDVDNFADLKASRGAAHRRRDHHRRQGDPDARLAPPRRRRRRSSRRSAARSRASRARWPSRASVADAPDRPAARPAGQRPGALRRPGRRRLHRGQRALRRGRGDRAPTSASTARRRPTRTTRPPAAARSSCSTAPRPARSTASSGSAYDGTDAAGRRATSSPAPQITTRDIDRGDFPHFLLKEITEAPASFRKTLRGKLVERDGRLRRAPRRRRAARRRARRPARRAHPPGARHRPGHRRVAGQSLAAALARRIADDRRSRCEALLATELSGFGLRADMSDTLVVAISQSGTTTDTNRTVDLVRGRGAPGDRHREPPQQRPHRQGRRRALHVRRPRRGDERRLDQGVLRADRGRLPAGAAPSPTRSGVGDRADRARAARARCASCPTR